MHIYTFSCSRRVKSYTHIRILIKLYISINIYIPTQVMVNKEWYHNNTSSTCKD